MSQKAPLPGKPSCLEKFPDVLLCYIPGETKDQNIFIHVKSINCLATDNYHPCQYERTNGVPALKEEWDKVYRNKSSSLRELSEDEITNIQKATQDRKEFLDLPATERSEEIKRELESRPTISSSYNPFAGLDKLLEKKG